MKKVLVSCSLFLIVILTSCSPIYYSPNTHNVPILKAKGDVRAGLFAGESRIEGMAAYALKDHLGILLNGGSFNTKDNDLGDGGSGKFIETGTGYYKMLNKWFQFESYGLLGYGALENHFPSTVINYPNTTGILNTRFMRLALQSSISCTTRYADFTFSTRLARLNYLNTNGSLIFGNIDQVVFIENRKKHFLIEPALTLRLGYDPIKIQVQLGRSVNTSHADFKQDDVSFTFGILCLLNKKNK
jgi:hypothetical protein